MENNESNLPRKKFNDKHRLVVDTYMINGFNGTEAWKKIYSKSSHHNAGSKFYHMMKRPEVKEYYDEKMAEYKEEIRLDKQKLIDRQMRLDNMFLDYLDLIVKLDRTEDEETLYKRYYKTFGKVDVTKNRDMLHRVGGFYAPIQSEVDHTINVEQPLFGPPTEDDTPTLDKKEEDDSEK